MTDSLLARYGHQDIHQIRGISRPLTPFEKDMFAHALLEHIEAEQAPLPQRHNPEG
ncbi:MAG TPA: hypothetical protein VFT22_10855 [Kofleriaceae bacterium]|nr:hypothetical protein [Kofleriaceae bacterium]